MNVVNISSKTYHPQRRFIIGVLAAGFIAASTTAQAGGNLQGNLQQFMHTKGGVRILSQNLPLATMLLNPGKKHVSVLEPMFKRLYDHTQTFDTRLEQMLQIGEVDGLTASQELAEEMLTAAKAANSDALHRIDLLGEVIKKRIIAGYYDKPSVTVEDDLDALSLWGLYGEAAQEKINQLKSEIGRAVVQRLQNKHQLRLGEIMVYAHALANHLKPPDNNQGFDVNPANSHFWGDEAQLSQP